MSRAGFAHAVESGSLARSSAASNFAASSLHINRPGDLYEQEADRAADQVVSNSPTSTSTHKLTWSLSTVGLQAPLQRQCTCSGGCEDCKTGRMLQREATGAPSHPVAPPIVHSVLGGAGRQLDPSTRSFMESRFGHDFSRVRIFNDGEAAKSAQAVSANAYTVGEKIVFNRDRYSPGSASGRRLLAHELAHVVQQSGHQVNNLMQRDDQDVEVVEEPPNKSNSVLQQAFDAADAKRWQVAARLANGLSPFEMKIFLSQYKDPELIKYLHQGALDAEGVGGQSAIALATEATYKVQKQKEEFQYQQRLAQENGTPPPSADGSPGETQAPSRPLTVQEKKRRCESGEDKKIMTFPLRLPRGLWRISVAPISAQRSGKDIVVRQPVNAVWADPMFGREVKTLPLETFLGGVKLAPDEVVRVRLYDDNERIICVTGEQMLKMSDATDTAVLLSIAGTALDAASVFAPGATQALVDRGLSAATAGLVVGGTNIALNEGLEATRQYSAVSYGLQDHIQWGQIVFDTLLQAVTLGFGGKLTDAVVKRVAGAATGPYTGPALRAAVVTVLQGSFAVVQSVARSLFRKLQGEKRDITVGDFLEELAGEFAQGVLFHLIMQAVPEAEPSGRQGAHGESNAPRPAPVHDEEAAHPETQHEIREPGHSPPNTVEMQNAVSPVPAVDAATETLKAAESVELPSKAEAPASATTPPAETAAPKESVPPPRAVTPGGHDDPLVVAKVEGPQKGQYWREGTSQFRSNAGSPSEGPDPRYVVLPKSQAEVLGFREAGTAPNFEITPRVVGGEQAESTGAGRRTAGADPDPRGYKGKPAHPIMARTARQAGPAVAETSESLETDEPNKAAETAFKKTVGADLLQAAGQNELISRGEKVILRPGNISSGGVDSITAEVNGDQTKIFLNDFTVPEQSKAPETVNWRRELDAAVAGNRLNFGNKTVDDAIRKAIANGEVYLRIVRVKITPKEVVVTFDAPEKL